MAKKTIDITALGLVLVGVFLFFLSWREAGWLKWVGAIGSIVLVVTELIFLWEKWFK